MLEGQKYDEADLTDGSHKTRCLYPKNSAHLISQEYCKIGLDARDKR